MSSLFTLLAPVQFPTVQDVKIGPMKRLKGWEIGNCRVFGKFLRRR